MLKAGVSIVDISPEVGVCLAGYPHCPRPNTGIHDPLYASCLYLQNENTDVVIVTMDLLFFGKEYVRYLRKKTGKTIMFSASHTHSGPWSAEVLASEKADGITVDDKYTKGLLDKVYAGIMEAVSNTFEAKLGTFVGKCGAEQGVGGNRRDKNGICDPSVNVIAVKDARDTLRACFVNYALHPTYLHAENTLVTADYPAYIRRFLSFAFPESITMFAQGASGDQSSRYHRTGQDFEEAARAGTTIGTEVFRCVNAITFSSDIKIEVKSTETDLPLKVFPTPEEAEAKVKEAKEKLEATNIEDYINLRNAELALFGAENLLTYAKLSEKGYKSGELPCEIQMLTLGDTLIIGIQGEIFVEYALEIKKTAPCEKVFVSSVTNGALPGYVYTPKAGVEGGYEVGTSMLAPNAGEAIINKIKEMF